MPLPNLPPAYNLVALDREVGAFERAVRAAPRGIDDGTVYWTDRADRLEVAVVLEPEAAAAATLESLYVMTVATGDALSALLPPLKPVAFAWPGHILLDGAGLGRVRAALAPVAGEDAVPPWLVLGLGIAVGPLGDDPGRFPDRTSLYEEGAGDVTVDALLESVGRHFLRWTGRWLDEGLEPVRASWNRRCFQHGEVGELVLGGERFAGPVRGLAEDGTFVIDRARLDLLHHLPSIG
jgi:biotin-(acetyl-CoA carboxylase) ligase